MQMSRTKLTLVLLLGWVVTSCGLAAAQTDKLPSNPVVSIAATSAKTQILTGESAQLSVIATFTDGTRSDVTAASGINYTPSVDGVISVEGGGLVHGVTRGTVTIVISFEQSAEISANTSIDFDVRIPNDSDNDGMPDAWEIAHGLNPNDPSDADQDPDSDGLTNLQEYQHGTDPHNPDTDGDGVPDGLEVGLGTDPLNPNDPPPQPPPFAINDKCTATLLNRSIQISPDGTFALPNIPVDQGFYRVRIVCTNPDHTTTEAASGFLTLNANGETLIGPLVVGNIDPAPVAIAVSASSTTLATSGQTVQLAVQGTLPTNTVKDLSTRALGTLYISSNPAIATVSADGLVTAVSRGTAIITARNEGASATIQITVNIPVSSLND